MYFRSQTGPLLNTTDGIFKCPESQSISQLKKKKKRNFREFEGLFCGGQNKLGWLYLMFDITIGQLPFIAYYLPEHQKKPFKANFSKSVFSTCSPDMFHYCGSHSSGQKDGLLSVPSSAPMAKKHWQRVRNFYETTF